MNRAAGPIHAKRGAVGECQVKANRALRLRRAGGVGRRIDSDTSVVPPAGKREGGHHRRGENGCAGQECGADRGAVSVRGELAVIQSVHGQQARLTEWQNPAGEPMAFVSNIGRIYAFAGSEGLPGVGNAQDTDTGMYFPAPDTVGWSVGGQAAMRLDESALALHDRPVVGVADPEGPQDAATKAYVDRQIDALREELGR